MADAEDELPSAGRGPAYPYLPFPKVMDRVLKVHGDGLTRMEVNPVSYYKSWGYSKENGNARQTMAALNHFGLVEYIGRGKDRKVKLSKLALTIVLDKNPGSITRALAIREAALKPSVYSALWNNFDGSLVPDHAMEKYLTLDLNYSEDAAQKVISGYRDTFSYANLSEDSNKAAFETDLAPDVAPLVDDESNDKKATENLEVGDLVQVEIDGAYAFDQPKRLRAIRSHEGVDWGFVDGSETGIPMKQMIFQAKSATTPVFAIPPTLPEGLPLGGRINEAPIRSGEREWLRGPLSKGTAYRLIVEGDLGPREISKLIKLLEAQKAVLDDDDED
jgi:hypothetical protein